MQQEWREPLRRVMKNRFLSLALVALLVACVPGDPSYRIVTLPSGKAVKVLGVGTMHFSNGPAALMLKYETDVPLENKVALEKEANEIWESFKVDVEKAQLANAIISANTKPTGFIVTTSKGYNFVYQRSSGGQWSKLPDKG